jgi:ATP-dependent Clp protease ATP-binding subunit ClpX
MDGLRHAAIDTGRLLFICTGAFVGLQDIVERRVGGGRSSIGFVARREEPLEGLPDRPVFTALCQAQTTDLVAFGMIPELIGRFATVSVLHELSKDDLRQILDAVRSALSR